MFCEYQHIRMAFRTSHPLPWMIRVCWDFIIAFITVSLCADLYSIFLCMVLVCPLCGGIPYTTLFYCVLDCVYLLYQWQCLLCRAGFCAYLLHPLLVQLPFNCLWHAYISYTLVPFWSLSGSVSVWLGIRYKVSSIRFCCVCSNNCIQRSALLACLALSCPS